MTVRAMLPISKLNVATMFDATPRTPASVALRRAGTLETMRRTDVMSRRDEVAPVPMMRANAIVARRTDAVEDEMRRFTVERRADAACAALAMRCAACMSVMMR